MARPSRTFTCRPHPAPHSRQVVEYQVASPGVWSSGGTTYGTSFSVGSGPIPHPDSAAAPPPATPSTLRNRRRSIPSLISSRLVVAHRAVTAHVAGHVTADAPPHLQGGDLVDL